MKMKELSEKVKGKRKGVISWQVGTDAFDEHVYYR